MAVLRRRPLGVEVDLHLSTVDSLEARGAGKEPAEDSHRRSAHEDVVDALQMFIGIAPFIDGEPASFLSQFDGVVATYNSAVTALYDASGHKPPTCDSSRLDSWC